MYVSRERSHSTMPASLMRTAIVLALSLLLGVLFVHWLQLRDSRSFNGNVYAQKAIIKATRDAEVTRVFVAVGETVEAQQDVVVLRDNSLRKMLSSKQREVETLASELQNSVAKAEMDLKWRLREIDKEILQNRLVATNRIQPAAMRTGDDDAYIDDRFKEVSHRRFTNDADEDINVVIEERDYKPLIYFRPDNAGDDAVKAVVVRRTVVKKKEPQTISPERRRLCEQRIGELEQMKNGLEVRTRQAAGVDICQTKHDHALRELEDYEDQATEFALKTIRTGTVTRVLQASGSRVRKGDPIVQIIDPSMKHIIVTVPADQISRFETGSELDVIFGGHQKRTGRVEQIPMEVASNANGQSGLAVTIVPSGRLWPAVPIGAPVEVRVRN